jgi:NAD(P)-dependent dehydrogenase (short-subunit alcohol dehydrogenase family)
MGFYSPQTLVHDARRHAARQARAEGADVIITGRDQQKLAAAAAEVGALDAAAFDVADADELEHFFSRLPEHVNHLLLTAGGPYHAPLAEMDFEQAGRTLNGLLTRLRIARDAQTRIRTDGSLLLIGGPGARRPGVGLTLPGMVTAALQALTANLAVELAPVRVNLIAAGFVDTHCLHHCSATSSRPGANSCTQPCRSGGWSGRTTSRRWPCT